MRIKAAVICTIASLAALAAHAQPISPPAASRTGPEMNTRTFNVQHMSFDSWCQETQRYTAERCAARQAADVQAFDAYRATIERYEIEFLRQRQGERDSLERVTRDPTDLPRTLQDQVIQ